MNLSIVIPALNEEAMIEQCLSSIRRQDQPIEIILVDNGSVDRTPEIAKKYCDVILIEPGYSLAEMRDQGAREAKGDIVVTTDADCVAPPHWISELTKPFYDPGVVAVGGALRPLKRSLLGGFYCWISAVVQGLFGLYQGANMAYRRDVYLRSPGYAGAKRAEDWNLSWNLRRYGKTKFIRKAYTYTEIPFNRQIEYVGVIASGILIILGGVLGWVNLLGFGLGYILSEAATFIYKHRSILRRSQVTLIALALVFIFQRTLTVVNYTFIAGLLGGIFAYHFISEDIRLVIEDLKLYNLRKRPDHSFLSVIKQHISRVIRL